MIPIHMRVLGISKLREAEASKGEWEREWELRYFLLETKLSIV